MKSPCSSLFVWPKLQLQLGAIGYFNLKLAQTVGSFMDYSFLFTAAATPFPGMYTAAATPFPGLYNLWQFRPTFSKGMLQLSVCRHLRYSWPLLRLRGRIMYLLFFSTWVVKDNRDEIVCVLPVPSIVELCMKISSIFVKNSCHKFAFYKYPLMPFYLAK